MAHTILSRRDALAAGLRRYFTGQPCAQGHIAPRTTHNCSCIACQSGYNRSAAVKERRAKWNAFNASKYAAIQGAACARARAPDCIPPSYAVDSCIRFYMEARRLTRVTGIPHEVDHIIALSDGGEHTASNLQVLTAAANKAKRYA